MIYNQVSYQWRTHKGGFGGQLPLSLTIAKEMKTSLFVTVRLFSCRDCCHVFLVLSNLFTIILKNFRCDAIISIGALHLTIAEKVKPFLCVTNRLFFVRSLQKLLSCFFYSIQLFNSISRNFYYQGRKSMLSIGGDDSANLTILCHFSKLGG